MDEDSRGNPYAAGELIVTYEERVSEIQDENAREEALAAKKRELAADPAVESVTYNYLLQIQTADSLYDLQWHLPRI